jgi:hypothetical protein
VLAPHPAQDDDILKGAAAADFPLLLHAFAGAQRDVLFLQNLKDLREHVTEMLADHIVGGLGAQRLKFREAVPELDAQQTLELLGLILDPLLAMGLHGCGLVFVMAGDFFQLLAEFRDRLLELRVVSLQFLEIRGLHPGLGGPATGRTTTALPGRFFLPSAESGFCLMQFPAQTRDMRLDLAQGAG